MKKFINITILLFTLFSCTNSHELETGEIKTLRLLKDSFIQLNNPKAFIDARKLLSRERVDEIGSPILFVEMQSGQNGTLTPYPGKGLGQHWISADGATVTTDNGILIASRGMGDDLMGSVAPIPPWINLKTNGGAYIRQLSYLDGSNKIYSLNLKCEIKKIHKKTRITVWNASFKVNNYEEVCTDTKRLIRNTYHVGNDGVVRESYQYHSDTLGYIMLQRLDR